MNELRAKVFGGEAKAKSLSFTVGGWWEAVVARVPAPFTLWRERLLAKI